MSKLKIVYVFLVASLAFNTYLLLKINHFDIRGLFSWLLDPRTIYYESCPNAVVKNRICSIKILEKQSDHSVVRVHYHYVKADEYYNTIGVKANKGSHDNVVGTRGGFDLIEGDNTIDIPFGLYQSYSYTEEEPYTSKFITVKAQGLTEDRKRYTSPHIFDVSTKFERPWYATHDSQFSLNSISRAESIREKEIERKKTPNKKEIIAFREQFQRRFPKPDWWDQVSLENVEVTNYDELIQVWQESFNDNPRTYWKAAYTAILNYPLNNDIVVSAISGMYSADRSYPKNTELLEFAIENYFEHKKPLKDYAGKVGDDIGGICKKLVSIYVSENRSDMAIELAERLLFQRKDELNDHMLESISLGYATALYDKGETRKAIDVLEEAIEEYHGSWEKRLKKQLSLYKSNEIELDGSQIFSASIVVMMAHTVNLFLDSECKKHVTMDKDIGMLIERMVNEFGISNREELKNALSTPDLRKRAEHNIGSVKSQVDRDSPGRAGGRDESCQRLIKYFESEHNDLYSKWINSIDTKLH